MASVSRDEVRRIARLARIHVADAEAGALARDLAAVLEYVKLLESLDTSGVEAMSTVIPLATPLRADEPSEPLAPEVAVMNAPSADGSAFSVPRVLGADPEG
jgi:aspartyl-tRNA(Asn)/glutamyl-tRNA(Gln) amidotransferase subunit C